MPKARSYFSATVHTTLTRLPIVTRQRQLSLLLISVAPLAARVSPPGVLELERREPFGLPDATRPLPDVLTRERRRRVRPLHGRVDAEGGCPEVAGRRSPGASLKGRRDGVIEGHQ